MDTINVQVQTVRTKRMGKVSSSTLFSWVYPDGKAVSGYSTQAKVKSLLAAKGLTPDFWKGETLTFNE
jgi:hypothetical protein